MLDDTISDLAFRARMMVIPRIVALKGGGAELRPMGRIPFLDVDTGEPNPAPSCVTAFILRG